MPAGEARCMVLTGATGGIGRCAVQQFSAQGWRLLLLGRNESSLAELAAATGQEYLACDLTVSADRQRVLQRCQEVFGSLDALVQCAGVNAFGLHDLQSDQAIERLLQTNLIAPMQLTRLLMPLLERGREPVIVNVGSVFGHIGFPGFSIYSASKFGLRGYTEALRRECSDGPVRVAWLAPRATRTTMNSGLVDRLNAELKVNYDTPETVATAIVASVARPVRERVLGFPEKLVARINQLFPRLVDTALMSQVPIIRRYNRQAMEHST